MKRLFLDTNVVLDYLLERPPLDLPAQQLLASQGSVFQVSSLTMTTAHYIGRRPLGTAGILAALKAFARQVVIVDTGAATVVQALQADASGFEDAVQLYAALAAGAEAIVTRDPRGFRGSPVPVLDPLAALRQL